MTHGLEIPSTPINQAEHTFTDSAKTPQISKTTSENNRS